MTALAIPPRCRRPGAPEPDHAAPAVHAVRHPHRPLPPAPLHHAPRGGRPRRPLRPHAAASPTPPRLPPAARGAPAARQPPVPRLQSGGQPQRARALADRSCRLALLWCRRATAAPWTSPPLSPSRGTARCTSSGWAPRQLRSHAGAPAVAPSPARLAGAALCRAARCAAELAECSRLRGGAAAAGGLPGLVGTWGGGRCRAPLCCTRAAQPTPLPPPRPAPPCARAVLVQVLGRQLDAAASVRLQDGPRRRAGQEPDDRAGIPGGGAPAVAPQPRGHALGAGAALLRLLAGPHVWQLVGGPPGCWALPAAGPAPARSSARLPSLACLPCTSCRGMASRHLTSRPRCLHTCPPAARSQHVFVDPAHPDDAYRSTYNCIAAADNQRTYNDGYHIQHHLNSRLHWSAMPQRFLDTLAEHEEHDGEWRALLAALWLPRAKERAGACACCWTCPRLCRGRHPGHRACLTTCGCVCCLPAACSAGVQEDPLF